MKNFLTQDERESLKVWHKKERDKRVCDRIKAVLLRDKGWNYREIAEVLLLTEEAIRQHIKDYEASEKLKPENGGSTSKLSAEQTQMLLERLDAHTYLYTKDIIVYVREHFEIEYTVAGMHSWLKSHGFSYKKPSVVPGKANREDQEAWIREYEALKSDLPPDEVICFIDGVHPTHNAKPAFGWIKKGKRKEIPTNTGRQRLNLTGAIEIATHNVLIQEDVTLNASSTIAFLKKLELAYPCASKIHTFSDNARYYRNKEVLEYLKTSRVEMHFLPPYSPNLNLIERLWKFMNERVLYNKYYEKFSGFRAAVLGFLESLWFPDKDTLMALKSRITDNFQLIGKPIPNSSI